MGELVRLQVMSELAVRRLTRRRAATLLWRGSSRGAVLRAMRVRQQRLGREHY